MHSEEAIKNAARCSMVTVFPQRFSPETHSQFIRTRYTRPRYTQTTQVLLSYSLHVFPSYIHVYPQLASCSHKTTRVNI